MQRGNVVYCSTGATRNHDYRSRHTRVYIRNIVSVLGTDTRTKEMHTFTGHALRGGGTLQMENVSHRDMNQTNEKHNTVEAKAGVKQGDFNHGENFINEN